MKFASFSVTTDPDQVSMIAAGFLDEGGKALIVEMDVPYTADIDLPRKLLSLDGETLKVEAQMP